MPRKEAGFGAKWCSDALPFQLLFHDVYDSSGNDCMQGVSTEAQLLSVK